VTGPAIRRLGQAIREQSTQPPLQTLQFLRSTITTVTASGSVDGTYQVTFDDRGVNVLAPYLAAYSNGHTPTVGDTVGVLLVDGVPIILDRVRGLPTF
jgi:hypothetical protein